MKSPSRLRFPVFFAVLTGIFVPLLPAQNAAIEDQLAIMPEKHFEFFEKYCVECHDDVTDEGSLNLYDLPFDLGTIQSAETWQKVLNSINSGEMPPKEEKQPTAEDKVAFLEALSRKLVVARDLLSDTGGEITMRRLNRREYKNTIEDLLHVQVDTEDLPNDSNPGGFDTAGGSLFFSSDQFEQYLKVAGTALNEAIVTGPKPKPGKVRLEAEKAATKQATKRLASLQKSWDRAQAWRASDKDPTEFGFIDADRVKFEEGGYKRQAPGLKAYLSWPESNTGAVLHTQFNGAYLVNPEIPAKAPSGNYRLRFRAAVINDKVSWPRRFLEYGIAGNGAQAGEIAVEGCVHIKGTMEEPQIIDVPITLSEGSPRLYGIRERQVNNRDFARHVFTKAKAEGKPLPDPALWIDWVEWEGPLVEEWPPKSHLAIFPKDFPDQPDTAAIEDVLTRFATKAFRLRKPSDSFLKTLTELYEVQIAAGNPPLEAIKEPLAVILSSPGFLYLAEPVEKPWLKESGKPQPKRVPLTKREFAIRLAYFLWSSPPDAELLSLAMEGKLKEPDVLRSQTERMLADPRAREFITGFTHQWLHMERLDFFNYNFRKFPEFDESVKESAREEIYHTIEFVLRKNRPIGDLLDPDFLVVNDVLRNYYRLGGLQGGEEGAKFEKVKIPENSPRGGLLGMAAILAMGSDGERTSPVERGAWVMRKLLHNPPPPAPPNVPQLSRNADKPVSGRELLKLHNEEAQCAQCHQRIDPLGFGLEHFNAAGLWREKEVVEIHQGRRVVKTKQFPIDSSGALPDGTPFTGFEEMRKLIGEREEDFAQGFTEHLIEYGLGRPFGFSDLNLAESILDSARKKDFGMSEFVHALVQSKSFRLK
ncbi:MAG: DUF1592 domain-containing protein [Verrucomicrobiales bacterium]|nr:DUF1592 domain-containing protein [Verrucomicrobiales bacterium]